MMAAEGLPVEVACRVLSVSSAAARPLSASSDA
jgi:hypothetical protein